MPAEPPCIQILRLNAPPSDVEAIRELLAREGLNSSFTHVTGRDEFEACLSGGSFDVVLTDYIIAGYDGLSALRCVKHLAPGTPVILISGALGEELAVQCMKEGAIDILPKDRPDRLVAALRHALQKGAEARFLCKTEALLRESQEGFGQLAERIEDVFWSTTPERQTPYYVSPAFERVWGRSPEELRTCPKIWWDSIRTEDQPRVRYALQGLAEGVDYEIEYRIRMPDGRLRWILDRGFALRDTDGNVHRLVGVATDVTDRELAEKSRRQNEERLAAIFTASPIAIAFGTIDGRLVDVNPEFCRLFGYRRDELVNKAGMGSIPWADSEARELALAKLGKHKALRNFEAKFRRKSNELRSGLVSMEMLQLGNEPMLLTLFVDVTEQKALEAQLHRTQRLESVGQLTSGIAHDMNNILAPIIMAVPLLRTGLSSSTETLLSAIEISAQRGAALARQLLSFGRGVEGARNPVNLAAIINEVATFSRQTFPRNISIIGQVPDLLWSAHGDVTQLNQVVLNLCVNARDAMPAGGRLIVSAENIELDEHEAALHPDTKPGRYVMLRVVDTGEGIAPENIDRIFDPFFTTKEEGKGTGLGLSTVMGIVKSHGGFVRLTSEPGHGATFDIYLPASSGKESDTVIADAAEFVQGNGELIMVVDDEEHIRGVLRDVFLQCNYQVITAQDGVEATAAFIANPSVRLVLTDLDMPLIDGLSLARSLRRLNSSVRFVISTGLGEKGGAGKHQQEFDELGVRAVLTKPYTSEKLLRVIHDALA
jgi:PAS domain S-box-containing protein